MLQCLHQPPEVREQAGAPGKAGSWPPLGESGSAVCGVGTVGGVGVIVAQPLQIPSP